MEDIYDRLARTIMVIRETAELREAFNKVLGADHGAQRVPLLFREMEAISAPEIVLEFVTLLSDDSVAALVLEEINRNP